MLHLKFPNATFDLFLNFNFTKRSVNVLALRNATHGREFKHFSNFSHL